MATFNTSPDGSQEISLPDSMFTDAATDLVIMPSGDGEVFIECGNCTGTAGSRVSREDLRALRDFLVEHIKD